MAISSFYNLEAEVQVLGSMLNNNNNSFYEIIDVLSYEDFYNPRHQIIYKAMSDMYDDGLAVDVTTLSDRLGAKLAEVGDITYISEIYASSLIAAGITSYAEIIKEKSRRRKLMKILKESSVALKEKDIECTDAIEEIQEKFISINIEKGKEDGSLYETVDNFINKLDQRYKNGGDIQGIRCGIRQLDKILGGLMPQDFIIIAARPSMGKTAVAINLALNCAVKANAKTAFFNLEMGKAQIIERAVSSLSEIPMKNLKCGDLNDNQWMLASKAGLEMTSSALKIYDKVFTLRKLKEECKRLKLQGGLDLVFIDYLQLINSEDRADHKPLLSDLRESGAIEQDADIVMLLYRDDYYYSDSNHHNTIDCIIAKNRNGEVTTARLKWQGECQKVG